MSPASPGEKKVHIMLLLLATVYRKIVLKQTVLVMNSCLTDATSGLVKVRVSLSFSRKVKCNVFCGRTEGYSGDCAFNCARPLHRKSEIEFHTLSLKWSLLEGTVMMTQVTRGYIFGTALLRTAQGCALLLSIWPFNFPLSHHQEIEEVRLVSDAWKLSAIAHIKYPMLRLLMGNPTVICVRIIQ